MNAGQLAELIAAGFWAVLVCVVVFVLFRLARLISAGTRMLTEQHERTGLLLDAAQAAVDRTTGQLDRTEAITASLDQSPPRWPGFPVTSARWREWPRASPPDSARRCCGSPRRFTDCAGQWHSAGPRGLRCPDRGKGSPVPARPSVALSVR